jgi:hypothetical protein
MKGKLILIALFFLSIGTYTYSQKYDSIHVYAINMNASYDIKIDKDLIKNQTDPIVLTQQKQINSVDLFLLNKIKAAKIKKLKSNQLDIRLLFEFYTKDKISKVIGVSPYKEMFINYTLYKYD